MISIKRRRQIKRAFITTIICGIFISVALVVGYFPYGLHKKDMSKVKMPKDSIIYMSAKSLDKSLFKFSKSIYAYRVSHDESMYNFSFMIKSIEALFFNLRENSNLLIRMITHSITKRNASILLWNYNNSLEDSDIYYFFDLGYITTFIANALFRVDEVYLDKVKYNVNIVDYNEYKFYSLERGNYTSFFVFYDGLLIVAPTYTSLRKIIDFLNSKSSSLGDINILNNAKVNYSPDMSLYINKDYFDYKKISGSILFKPLEYFKDTYSIYANMNLSDNNGNIDIFVNYHMGGSDRVSLYDIRNDNFRISNYLSKENTVFYVALKSYLSGLYPILYNDLINNNSSVLRRKLLNLFFIMNHKYSFLSIISDLYGDFAIAYIESQKNKLIYPVVIFDIRNGENLLIKLETELTKKYPTLRKDEKGYNNNFIYSYVLPDNSRLFYAFINGIYFFSESEAAVQTLIDNSYDSESLTQYINKKVERNYKPNYLLTLNLSKAHSMLRELNIPLRVYSYPNDIIYSSTIHKDYTHININFRANFNSID